MYSILTYINTHLILIQDELELGEVFMCITAAAVVILMRSWNEMSDKITMVQQKLSNAADDKELGCMMCHVLTTGQILGIFFLQPEETETNFRLKCRIMFQIRTQKLYYSFVPVKVHTFHIVTLVSNAILNNMCLLL